MNIKILNGYFSFHNAVVGLMLKGCLKLQRGHYSSPFLVKYRNIAVLKSSGVLSTQSAPLSNMKGVMVVVTYDHWTVVIASKMFVRILVDNILAGNAPSLE